MVNHYITFVGPGGIKLIEDNNHNNSLFKRENTDIKQPVIFPEALLLASWKSRQQVLNAFKLQDIFQISLDISVWNIKINLISFFILEKELRLAKEKEEEEKNPDKKKVY